MQNFFDDPVYGTMVLQLLGSLLAGSIIGLERSWRGRDAGFRTHGLVSVASTLLMLLSIYQSHWLKQDNVIHFTTDPTRMAQGIMTGIGFLGAGVIYKHGITVRGLTTAASIWITAAIGILIGVGFYFPAVVACTLVLTNLSLFGLIKHKLPARIYLHHTVLFTREHAMDENEFRRLLVNHHFRIISLNYQLIRDGTYFEYQAVIWTSRQRHISTFAEILQRLPTIKEFKLVSIND